MTKLVYFEIDAYFFYTLKNSTKFLTSTTNLAKHSVFCHFRNEHFDNVSTALETRQNKETQWTRLIAVSLFVSRTIKILIVAVSKHNRDRLRIWRPFLIANCPSDVLLVAAFRGMIFVLNSRSVRMIYDRIAGKPRFIILKNISPIIPPHPRFHDLSHSTTSFTSFFRLRFGRTLLSARPVKLSLNDSPLCTHHYRPSICDDFHIIFDCPKSSPNHASIMWKFNLANIPNTFPPLPILSFLDHSGFIIKILGVWVVPLTFPSHSYRTYALLFVLLLLWKLVVITKSQ